MILAEDVSVETGVGTIVGEIQSEIFNGTTYKFKQFLGVPYDEDPTGEKRFNKPQKKANFSEPFIAKTLPPFCPQNPAYLEFFGITLDPGSQNEDCLRLNIFTPEQDPQDDAKRPVMVWIHGGFYEVETQNWYLAKLLAAMNNIIYVTLNYRLSVLGFLSTGDDTLPGNNGLWDQHMAIKWVYDQIENFGGDPEKITIAGESAGSAAVVHHALYKGSQNLFNGVIAQSGSANNAFMIEMNPQAKFHNLVEKTGCSKNETSESIACLRNKPLA
ncbi:MAG: carboxylesterase family protein, partial [Candidatus Thiodiazotropha sp.]